MHARCCGCCCCCCTDIDECELKAHNCHEHAQCINIEGKFRCECLPNMEGNGLQCTGCHPALSLSLSSFYRHSYPGPVTVHQCLNGRAPLYLSDHCTPLSAGTRRHLRSTNRNLLAVLHHRLNTYGGRAFAVAGPAVWNSLPDFIRDPSISTDSFRRLLKTYLFARY